MAFMKLFAEKDVWYTVENSRGESVLLPGSLVGYLPIPSGHSSATEDDCTPEDWEAIQDMLRDYVRGPIVEVSAKDGWAARYSAPGYLDCTDWGGVYETREEAERECRDMYGDDEEESDDE